MKRYLKKAFFLLVMIILCGCSGNYSKIDLQNGIALPENGVVDQSTFEQIRKEDVIAVFSGTSNGIAYEWTVFGSDLAECRDINLGVVIETQEGTSENGEDTVQIQFAEQSPFGFPALLSVHLNEIWDAQSATVYQNDQPVASVSITGTKGTILNFSVNETLGICRVVADKEPEEIAALAGSESEESVFDSEKSKSVEKTLASEEPHVVDSYLTAVKDTVADTDVYVSNRMDSQKDAQTAGNTGSDGSESTNSKTDDYLSAVQSSSGRVYSDGKQKEKDKYSTDPVPAGKPLPVEPENQEIDDTKTYTCTFSIECATILNNLQDLDPDKLEMVPSSGVILKKKKVKFSKGESVYDVLQRICQEEGIHMESSWTPIYNSAYIEGINNLYEFDCGSGSGWMYRVNGWYPNYGCSRYQLEDGDVVEWRYTCNLGKDIGGSYAVGG